MIGRQQLRSCGRQESPGSKRQETRCKPGPERAGGPLPKGRGHVGGINHPREQQKRSFGYAQD